MKVILFGKNTEEIESAVQKTDFEIVKNNPEFIISYGGDGTLMKAEHAYPGIPKILLKNSMICKKCSEFSNEEVLRSVQEHKYTVEQLVKLEVYAAGKTFQAINDVTVHNKDARHAIRYALSVSGKLISDTIIGDGVVVATPFGSTGYYRSITDSYFEVGIGLAFNNSTEQSDHIVLKDDGIIEIRIIRGPAIVYADNQENSIEVEEGTEVKIKKSSAIASIVIPHI